MQSVFITGITSGIGHIVLQLLIRNGFEVTGVVRTLEQKKKLLSKYPGLTLYMAELSDKNQVGKLLASLKDKVYDYVVLNAGYGVMGYFDELPANHVDDMMQANLLANMQIVHQLLPGGIKQGTKFVFVSSILARLPGIYCATYATSKAALSQFYTSLRVEYPKLPLLCIEIGATKTAFHKKAGMEGASGPAMKSQELIGRRLYHAILNSTDVKTLAFEWSFIRRVAMIFGGGMVPIMMFIGGKRSHHRRR